MLMAHSTTDAEIAARLQDVQKLVEDAVQRAGDDRSRAGILSTIAVLLRQPVDAAGVLAAYDRAEAP
jgi:hypothetical protein